MTVGRGEINTQGRLNLEDDYTGNVYPLGFSLPIFFNCRYDHTTMNDNIKYNTQFLDNPTN